MPTEGHGVLNPLHLRTLAVILRTGSFAGAAKELGYTSSAVSQQMVALERHAHVTLFERHPRHVAPTPAATFLAERAAEVLAMFDGLEDDVRSIAGGLMGDLRIGSFPTASEHLLPDAIAMIIQQLPDVGIELEEGEPDELIPLISERRIDVALVYEYDLVPRAWPRGIQRSTLLSEEILVLLPVNHPGEGSIDLVDLRDDVWISTAVGTSGSECLQRICAKQGFVPRVDYRTNDYDVVRRFVGAGLGVALVPQLGAVDDDKTRVVRISGEAPQRRIIGVRRRVGGSPIAVTALEAMMTTARQYRARWPSISDL